MTFAEFVRLSRAYKWVLVGSAIVGVLVMVAFTTRQPVLYAASSTGIVKVGTSGSVGEEMSNLQLADEKIKLYTTLISTTPVAERVIDELGLNASPGDVAGRLSAAVGTANTIRVQAIAPTPAEARDLAASAIDAVAEEVDAIEADGRRGGNQTQLVRILPLEEATLPGAPFTPNYKMAAAQGAAGGLIVAYVFIIARRLIDRRVRSVKDVEEATGSSVIGIIPKVDNLARANRGVQGDMGQAAEAFRQLRTNLRFVDVDHEARKIVITSALAGEGKSTVSANLARLVASAGQPVLLVDADLRRPTVATTFDLDPEIGLTQAIAGDINVRDAIVDSGMANLSLLPAGRIPPNPSELLGSQRMHDIVNDLSADYFVLLDAPPLLPVTDAGLLSAFTDGVLLVQATGRAAIEQSQHCRRILDHIGTRMLGVVLNKAPLKGIGAVAYGDGYGGYGAYGYRQEYKSQQAYSTAGKGRRRKESKATADA
jgi:succinoglycan biosynthesis transport protein ExoP